MTDAELELAVQRWLQRRCGRDLRAGCAARPDPGHPIGAAGVRVVVDRFATMPAIGASVATASIAGVLIATMFFGLFDRPAGTDGETCSNRQVQQALDNLRDAAGYRYVNLRQTHQLDPDAGLSFDDPQYVWTDGSTAEGAYLAPDRVIERVTIHARRALRPRLSRAPPDQWPHVPPHGGRWRGGMGRGHELAHAEPRVRVHRRGLPDVLGPARQRRGLGRGGGDGRAAWHRRMHRCDPHPGR